MKTSAATTKCSRAMSVCSKANWSMPIPGVLGKSYIGPAPEPSQQGGKADAA